LSWILTNYKALSSLRFDAAWFGSWVEDLIAYVQNSQDTIRPENVDAARILGFETSLRLHLFELISLEANYTFLHGINRSNKPHHKGNRLPGRPAHELYGRLEIGRVLSKWGFSTWFDVDYAGTNYMDPSNLNEDSLARLLFGVGGRVTYPAAGLTLTVEVRNLLDTIAIKDASGFERPLRDYEAFPLPGRTVLATLHFRI